MLSRKIGQIYNVMLIYMVFESETANSETTSFHNCHACTTCSIELVFPIASGWLGLDLQQVYITLSPYTLYDSMQMAANSSNVCDLLDCIIFWWWCQVWSFCVYCLRG